MIIKDLFKSDITRDIKGVITVGEEREEDVQKELEEYVVTKELDRHFRDFTKVFIKGVDGPTEKIGIWISGFFGSGKSHFLKMLGHLLSNREVAGKKALDYFQDKFEDPMLQADLRRIASTGSTDVIIFNIDAKGAPDSKLNKEAIVTVLLNTFNEYQGFHPLHPWVAELERKMTKDGTYDAFKEKYQEKTGISWDGSDGNAPGRDNFDFEHEEVVTALVDSGAMSTRESADEAYKRASGNLYVISIEKFSKMLREYCDSRGKDHRVVFLIDEVGQYIGPDTSLMLNLQTVSEELGKLLKGRAWIVVTAQEAIESVVHNLDKRKSDDFSKIMGRFPTRLTLSSTNADEVIRKRLLTKNGQVAEDSLKALYAGKSAILKNAISFSAGTAEMRSWSHETDFIECYPFIPYQMRLVQKVFEQIRRTGETGKHLSEGERSLLSAFHESAKSIAGEELGVLVPLSRFFDSLETFLEGSVRRVFEHARENSRLEEFDIEVLKALFMIKNLKEVPRNLENLTILLLDHLDADKIALRTRIQEALDRLVKETLVQSSGEEYIFLSDDEQEVGRGIKATDIEDRDVVDHLAETAFVDIYEDRRFAFTQWRSFPFDQRFDAVFRGKQGSPLIVYVLSPDGDGYDDDAFVRSTSQAGAGTVILRLPDGSYRRDTEELKKTEKFLRLNESKTATEKYQMILDAKRREIREIKSRIRASLEEAIANSEVYVEGAKVAITSKTAKEKMESALRQLAETVFSKFDLIQETVKGDDDVKAILRANDVEQLTLLAGDANDQALEEVLRYMDRMRIKDKRVTLKDLLDEFTDKPYGWSETDLQALVAKLLVQERLRLFDGKDKQRPLDRMEASTAALLTKTREADKVIVDIRYSTDKVFLDKARVVLRDLTHRGDWPDKEDNFFKEAKTAVSQLREDLRAYESRYVGRAYPGQKMLADARKSLDDLLEIHDQNAFFEAFKPRESELRDQADDIGTIRAFFKSQVTIWDDATSKAEFYGKSDVFLTADAREALRQIEEILKMPAPYGRIKDLPSLVDKARKSYEAVLAQEKKDASATVSGHVKTAAEILEAEGFSKDEASKLLKPLLEYSDKFDASNDINEVKSLASSINNAYEAVLADAERIKHAQLSKMGSSTPASPAPKKIKRLRISNLVTQAKPLKSEEDIDAFVGELRTRLMEELKDQDEVRLS